MKGVTIILAILAASPVAAQGTCADRDRIVENLEEKYGERHIGFGLQTAEKVFEVWASDEKGTWTILMTRSDGFACIMASGTSWQDGGRPSRPPNL